MIFLYIYFVLCIAIGVHAYAIFHDVNPPDSWAFWFAIFIRACPFVNLFWLALIFYVWIKTGMIGF